MAIRVKERQGHARALFAAIPLCLGFIACEDADDALPDPSGGAAMTAGDAGESSTTGGAGGNGGTSSAGQNGAGDTGEAGEAGAAGSAPERPCESDADCDNSSYCAGAEICVEIDSNTGLGHCVPPEAPPCWPEDCDEARRTCDCSDKSKRDHDNDGAYTKYCALELNAPEDCDDDDDNRSPNAHEVCDSKDVDEDCDPTTFSAPDLEDDTRADKDDDGHVDTQCRNRSFRTGGYIAGDDCDDQDPGSYPDAEEVCDNEDNNCDGKIDEVFGAPSETINYYYPDRDGDGWGNRDERLETRCDHPPSDLYTAQGRDCADGDPNVNPGRDELCNGIDDDCDDLPPDEAPLAEKPDFPRTDIACIDGAWKVISCPPNELDCENDASNGCEEDATTLCNCRTCGNRCLFSCGETACEEIVSMSMGRHHTCAIAAPTVDGVPARPGRAVCWGRNDAGQIGADPAVVTELDVGRAVGLGDVTALAAGYAHTCAIAGKESALLCWGSNAYGQVGTSGDDPEYFTPASVDGPDVPFSGIAAGRYHSCAVASSGALYCWGRGGLLGNGLTLDAPRPVRVRRRPKGVDLYVDNANRVVAGHDHSCLLTNTGEVECWGKNEDGQLGDGFATVEALVAQQVVLPGPVDSLCAGLFHTCALAGGVVYCWGLNGDRQLGIEGTSDGRPTLVSSIANSTALSCGASFTCALDEARTLRCWGSNLHGESGQTGTDPSAIPTVIPFPEDLTAVFGGAGYHACALTTDGRASCWGDNEFGKLGIGSVDPDPHPLPSPLMAQDGASCTDP